ncbi:hypothetical protein SD15574_1117 [Shigella dysenteriae 155-74]|nr:hypothetical protein SB521682_0835 [Shigella boydii 5216-82]EGJ01254.1 hypothetical protein SD15574_1117 [Shigella dysenteriae 155-74]EIQ28034.1 hypothetical protein SB96558_3056 [Shigella boydii 965-58]
MCNAYKPGAKQPGLFDIQHFAMGNNTASKSAPAARVS